VEQEVVLIDQVEEVQAVLEKVKLQQLHIQLVH
jgi:hypothetical protein